MGSRPHRRYPNKSPQPRMEDTLELCRLLHNRLRQESYEKSGKTLSYTPQANTFPGRKDGQSYASRER